MRRTRILLVQMPRMLSDIISDVIGSQPDMETVGTLTSRGALHATVTATRADVVLLGLVDSDLPSDCLPVFSAYPSIRMLGVVGEGRRTFLYELRPQRFSLGEVSPNGLVDAIRATGAHVVPGALPRASTTSPNP